MVYSHQRHRSLTPSGDVRGRGATARMLLIDREGSVRCGRWERRRSMTHMTGLA